MTKAPTITTHLAALKEQTASMSGIFDQLTTPFNAAVSTVQNGSKSMTDAFHSFTTSLIADIEKIAQKDIVSMLFGIGKGGDSSGAMAGTGLLSMISGFLATGGDVSPGNGYIVGENGPEFFMPSTSGSILNQSQMAGLGGGNTSITMNIFTPNAQSFRQNSGQIVADMQAALQRSQRNL